jgi:HSP20 family protein
MRYLVRTSPFRESDVWRETMNRFFDDEFFRGFGLAPVRGEDGWQALALDVSESDDSLKIQASLPGLNPDDVDISIHDGVLTIKGETQEETETEEEGKYYLRERRHGAFQRAIRLPVEVNADAAEAVFENGILTLTLPKAEEAKPKRITVNAS